MRLATWNVNSLKVRLPHVLAWLESHQPDALCLQETKTEDAGFPLEALRAAGYDAFYTGQKTYNGVAILSRHACDGAPVLEIPGFDDVQKRVIAATLCGVRVVSAYIPNGESVESEKYQYKMRWLKAFHAWLADELTRYPKLAVLGDYNIAPEARDVYDPAAWEGKVLFSEPERAAFQGLLDLGFKDAFRLFDQPERSYTWWDYRMNAYRRKMGLRIDHILVSPALAAGCTACVIDTAPRATERPSDHTPVYADIAYVAAGAA